MRSLMTAKQRKEYREAWTKGKKTEKYLDLELLIEVRENWANGKSYYGLTAWKGTAGKPFANYSFGSKERLDAYVERIKASADQRKKYKDERKIGNRYLTESAKASKMIKQILTREYPGIKFSVRSENFANGSAVRISWVDGVPEKEIESFANQFQYGHFNSMEDLYEPSNCKDFPQAKFVNVDRRVSEKNRQIILEQLAEKMGIQASESAIIPEEYMVNVRGYSYAPQLHALIYQISVNFDFTKGFNGVRNKVEDGVEIKNLFELY